MCSPGPVQSQDALKEISRCREDSTSRLDLSKGQLHSLPTSIRDLAVHLKELYLYSNKLVSLPVSVQFVQPLTMHYRAPEKKGKSKVESKKMEKFSGLRLQIDWGDARTPLFTTPSHIAQCL
ncbi:unnamed protein product [Echinostoma caproni]|uniref:Leucine-rich repeat and death domain-containing protein 1 n=1 Tax=Echinostoma caproni TaxID=27848 RepID=A0A183B3Q7_9TREM|nr:unnamed protein product [Echinostoma caproni]